MRTNRLAVVVAAAAALTFVVPEAEAQIECDIVAVPFERATKEAGHCKDGTGICMVFYLVCDGQPWPFPPSADAGPEPGHLVSPVPSPAFLSRSDTSLVAESLLEASAGPSLGASYCESDRLFEHLDRRRLPSRVGQGPKETRLAVGPMAPAPAPSIP